MEEKEKGRKRERVSKRIPALSQGLVLIKGITKQLQNQHGVTDYTPVEKKMGIGQKMDYQEERQ